MIRLNFLASIDRLVVILFWFSKESVRVISLVQTVIRAMSSANAKALIVHSDGQMTIPYDWYSFNLSTWLTASRKRTGDNIPPYLTIKTSNPTFSSL